MKEIVLEDDQEEGRRLSALPEQVTFNNVKGSESIKIHTKDVKLTGSMIIVITVIDEHTGITNSIQQLTVYIRCAKTLTMTAGPTEPITYKVEAGKNKPQKHKLLEEYKAEPSKCIDVGEITKEIVYTGSGDVPSFITFKKDKLTV